MLRSMTTVVTTPTERPVFVATDDRRARRLRYAAAAVGVVALAWVAALAIGMLGFGRLPSVSFPLVARGVDPVSSERAEPTPAPRPAVSRAESIARARTAARPAAAASPRPTTAVKRTSSRPRAAVAATPSRHDSRVSPRRRAAPIQAVQPPSPAPAATTLARQGWARRGATAPPGQDRRTTPEPVRANNHEAVPPGQSRRLGGNDATTAPATPVTTPVPPGQQKKADEPPPNA